MLVFSPQKGLNIQPAPGVHHHAAHRIARYDRGGWGLRSARYKVPDIMSQAGCCEDC